MDSSLPIGFFDSGLGGLSILAPAVKAFPHENFLYLGDSKHAPYGTKSQGEVQNLVDVAVKNMVNQGIKALVVACNTATSAAVGFLREKYYFPIIGLEPAIKLAHDRYQGGLTLVMATPLTLASKSAKRLFQEYGQHALPLPSPGLMDFVEREELNSLALDQYLEKLFEPYRNMTIASLVLGCTHYQFVQDQIIKNLRQDVRIFDGRDGTCRRLRSLLDQHGLLNQQDRPGTLSLQTTGDAEKLAQMHRMFKVAQSL